MSGWRSILALVLAIAALVTGVPAAAHGLLMKLDAQGAEMTGQVYFSNGQRAGGVWVELFEDGAPDVALHTIQSEPDGTFRLVGELGKNYQVRATGDEGHEIVMAIALEGQQSQAAMVDEPGDADEGFEWPAWAILGPLLALSLIPALFLRKREKA